MFFLRISICFLFVMSSLTQCPGGGSQTNCGYTTYSGYRAYYIEDFKSSGFIPTQAAHGWSLDSPTSNTNPFGAPVVCFSRNYFGYMASTDKLTKSFSFSEYYLGFATGPLYLAYFDLWPASYSYLKVNGNTLKSFYNENGGTSAHFCPEYNPSSPTNRNDNLADEQVPVVMTGYLGSTLTIEFSNELSQPITDGQWAISNFKLIMLLCADEHCGLCTDATDCQSCQTDWYLLGSSCYQPCPATYWGRTSDYTCQSCIANCDTCTGSTGCTLCKNGYFYHLGSCITPCPNQYWTRTSDRTCQSCITNCKTCSAATGCSLCMPSYYYYSIGDQCTTNCPIQYWNNPTGQVCSPCASNCETCTSSAGSGCTLCLSGYFYASTSSSCVATCPVKYWGRTSDRKCVSCIANCDTCTSSTGCSLCTNGYYYHLGSCITPCPNQYWPRTSDRTCQSCITNCKTCSAATGCSLCMPSYYYYSIGDQCTTNCPIQYWNNPTGQVCSPCSTGCETCTSSAGSGCTLCLSGWFYASTSSSCVTTCPVTYWGRTSDRKCVPCIANCDVCTASTGCNSCSAGFYYHSPVGQCIQPCPIQYWHNNGPPRTCDPCILNCKICSGSTGCQECMPGYFYFASTDKCLSSCPSEYFANPITQTCDPCIPGCQTCYDSDSCQQCLPGKFYDGAACGSTCPSYFYGRTATRRCEPCIDNCVTCSNANSCSWCDLYYYYTGSSCQDTCTVGYWPDPSDRTCKPCLPNCEKCSSGTYCDLCNINYYWDATYCSTTCSGSQWKYAETRSCQPDPRFLVTNPTGQMNISACEDQNLKASLNPEEDLYITNFVWQVQTIPSDLNLVSELVDYLATETTKELTILASLLKSSIRYNFTCSYLDSIGTNVSASVILYTYLDVVPKLEIDGSLTQNVQHFRDYVLKARSIPSDCITTKPSFGTFWLQFSGPALDFDQFIDPRNPMWLNFPGCSLTPGATYQIQLRVYLVSNPLLYNLIDTTLNILPEVFFAQISNGNRDHPSNQNLILNGQIVYERNCPNVDNSNVKYKWTCLKTPAGSYTTSPCSDPSNLFGVLSSSGTLNVPTSYFVPGDKLVFELTVRKNGVDATTNTVINIRTPNTLILSITCIDEKTGLLCVKYSSYRRAIFQVQIANQNYSSLLTYDWELYPLFYYSQYQNKIVISDEIYLEGGSVLTVQVTVKNSTNSGKASYELPMNEDPTDGILEISPPSGQSLFTVFNIKTYGWQDSDIPLTYQFFYDYKFPELMTESSSKGIIEAWANSLSEIQYNPYIYTVLPGRARSTTLTIKVNVIDVYGGTGTEETKVRVITNTTDPGQAAAQISQLISELSSNDPYEATRVLALCGSELNNWQLDLNEKLGNKNPCPGCSGNGKCGIIESTGQEVCICNDGYTLADCSMKKDDFDVIIDAKVKMMQVLNDSLSRLQEQVVEPCGTGLTWKDCVDKQDIQELSPLEKLAWETLTYLSNSDYLNTNQTLTHVQNIMEDNLHLTYQGITISEEDTKKASKVLDNMINFVSHSDCSCQTQFCQDLEEKTNLYLDAISLNNLLDKIPSDAASNFTNNLFDLITLKTSPCDLDKLEITSGLNTPIITFLQQNQDSLDCSKEIGVQYYVFQAREQIFNCDGTQSSKTKSHIAVRLINPDTGLEIDLNVDLSIRMPSGVACLPTCTKNSDGTCKCPISLFNVKEQITHIFKASDLSTIKNYKALYSWKFYTSPVFWTIFFVTVWYVVSYFKLQGKLYEFCVLREWRAKDYRTLCNDFKTAFVISHRMLNLYYYLHPTIAKETRALQYYLRVILYGTFSSIFMRAGSNKGFISLLSQLNIYLVILPYITILPINLLLDYMVAAPLFPNKNATKPKIHPLHLLKIVVVKVFVAALIGVCILIMFIIAANKKIDDQFSWTVNFGILLVNDQIVIPLLYFFSQFLLIKFVELGFIRKKPKVEKKLNTIIDDGLKEIFKSIERIAYTKYERVRKFDATGGYELNEKAVQTDAIDLSSISIPENIDFVKGKRRKMTTILPSLTSQPTSYNSYLDSSDAFRDFLKRKIMLEGPQKNHSHHESRFEKYIKTKIVSNFEEKKDED